MWWTRRISSGNRLPAVAAWTLCGLPVAVATSAQSPGRSSRLPIVGAQWEWIQGPTATIGFTLGSTARNRDDLNEFDGATVEFEPGAGGGKVGLGWWFLGPFGGLGARVAALHTWGSPRRVAPGLTYVGPELRALFFFVQLNGGLLVRAAGSAAFGRPAVVSTWGIGLSLPPVLLMRS